MAKKKISFDPELYSKLAVSDLILYGLNSVSSKKKGCTFEDLVKECFDSFPKVFSFSSISKWPDSRKLDRPLRTLRKRKLIKGDPKSSFVLTESGKKIAKETADILTQKKLW